MHGKQLGSGERSQLKSKLLAFSMCLSNCWLEWQHLAALKGTTISEWLGPLHRQHEWPQCQHIHSDMRLTPLHPFQARDARAHQGTEQGVALHSHDIVEAPEQPAVSGRGFLAGPGGGMKPRLLDKVSSLGPVRQYRGSSRFKGVSWSDRSGKWRAQMWFGNKVNGCPFYYSKKATNPFLATVSRFSESWHTTESCSLQVQLASAL